LTTRAGKRDNPAILPAGGLEAQALEAVIVSACLMGLPTRYDGRSKPSDILCELLEGCVPVPVCPEQLGGLPTPRPPCEISATDDRASDGDDVLDERARVIASDGSDCTEAYIRGADCVLKIAAAVGARKAIMKQNSPSCGCGFVMKGGVRTTGNGVCAALLLRHGLEIVPL